MAGRPTKKRTCAPPVSFRAMPENEIPPAMRVDIYLYHFQSEKQLFALIFKDGGVPPPHFRQIGGLPLYTAQLSSTISISKGSEYKPIYSAFKKERTAYEIQKS